MLHPLETSPSLPFVFSLQHKSPFMIKSFPFLRSNDLRNASMKLRTLKYLAQSSHRTAPANVIYVISGECRRFIWGPQTICLSEIFALC